MLVHQTCLIPNVCELVRNLSREYSIVFLSGRMGYQLVREATRNWIKYYIGLEHFELYLRPVKDYRPDGVLKPERIKDIPKEDVLCILEDRTVMVDKWRELGYTCFQVKSGDY